MVATPSVGNVSGASSGGTSLLTTPSQTVDAGSGLYVQVAMYGSSLSQPTVADAQGGVYSLIRGGNNGSVYLWVFRRSGPLSSSSSFTVSVTPSSSTAPIEAVAIEVLNHGETDAYSGLQTGTGTSETSSVSTTIRNDIVLFLGADHSATFSSWGSGQTGVSGYPTPPSNVTAWGSYQTQGATGSASSSRTVTASTTWIAVSIAVAPQTPWFSLGGKSVVTVSPIGQKTSIIYPEATVLVNNGADFGPDTPDTVTCGINEAVNSGAQSVVLLPGEFDTTGTIYLPNSYGINLLGTLSNQASPPVAPSSYINYSGTGWAIDTQSGGAISNGTRGFIDGIAVYTATSGVRLNYVNYNVGSLWIGGAGFASGSYGLYLEPISNAAEQHYNFLKVDQFDYLIYSSSEHLTIDHLNTSWPLANTPLVQWTGYGLHIGYWHHFVNGPGSPTYALEIVSSSSTAGPIRIDTMLWEGTLPLTALFHNAGTDNGAVISVGHLAYRKGGGPVAITYPQISATEDLVAVDHVDGSLRFGLEPVRVVGEDLRSGLTAADPVPITVYTATSNRIMRMQASLESGGGTWTSGSATYTIAWTDATSGNPLTQFVTVSNPSQSLTIPSIIIRVKSGTSITSQLTGSWTGTDTVTVSTVVEVIG